MSLKYSKHPERLRRLQAGISIVEALVALIILSVGMLGIAGLYLESLRSNRTAGARTVAVQLVNDMADRIRANRAGLDQYVLVDGTAPTGGSNCLTALCTPTQLALYDKVQWYNSVQAQLPKGPTGAIPPRTAITYTAAAGVAPARYIITTWWRETGNTDYLSTSVEVAILGAT